MQASTFTASLQAGTRESCSRKGIQHKNILMLHACCRCLNNISQHTHFTYMYKLVRNTNLIASGYARQHIPSQSSNPQ